MFYGTLIDINSNLEKTFFYGANKVTNIGYSTTGNMGDSDISYNGIFRSCKLKSVSE
jgi:hypothetical protein